MTHQPFVIESVHAAAPLSVLGTEVTVLATEETAGAYEVTLQRGDEGTGPPPHHHPWDESFLVLEGAVEFVLDGEPRRCPAGAFVHVPAGTVHGFRYGEGGGKMLEITSPGGATRMFRAVERELPPAAADLAHVVAVLRAHDVTVVPPAP